MIDPEYILRTSKQYGLEKQMIKTMEEAGELIQALAKYWFKNASLEKVVQEIVDVELLLIQLKTSLEIPEELYQRILTANIKRFKERVDSGTKNW